MLVQEAAARKKAQAEKLQTEERSRYEAQEAALQAELEVKAEAERKVRAERLAEQRRLEEERRRCAFCMKLSFHQSCKAYLLDKYRKYLETLTARPCHSHRATSDVSSAKKYVDKRDRDLELRRMLQIPSC